MSNNAPHSPTNPTAQDVLSFWLGDGLLYDWPSTDHSSPKATPGITPIKASSSY